ncbi:MAG: hypothetical protein J2P19_22340 [Pseudonocardia sp.]|nr:hypothetical protein [Pseudonocardia sp.]
MDAAGVRPRLFAAVMIEGVLLVAWAVATWQATGLVLVVAALGALIAIDGLCFVFVFPAVYKRENRRFRHFLEINAPASR